MCVCVCLLSAHGRSTRCPLSSALDHPGTVGLSCCRALWSSLSDRQRASLIRQIPTSAGFEFRPAVGIETGAVEQLSLSKTTSELQFCRPIRLNCTDSSYVMGSSCTASWTWMPPYTASPAGRYPGTRHPPGTKPSSESLYLTGPDVLIGCPGAPPAHLPTPGATGWQTQQQRDWTPDPRPKTQTPCVALLPSASAGRIWPIRRVRLIHSE